MYRKSDDTHGQLFQLLPRDQQKCRYISIYIALQCILICAAASTVFTCHWYPNKFDLDAYKLTSIMYLYDRAHCDHISDKTNKTVVQSLDISNDTMNLSVVAIRLKKPEVTVSTRLSAATRKYLKLSCGGHIIWMLLVILFFIIICHNKSPTALKCAIFALYYINIIVVILDISMAIVYVSHIKQSLTKGMIVRYSGWSRELDLEDPEDFAGWLPMLASVCWLRGIFLFGINILTIRGLHFIREKVQRREIMKRFSQSRNFPFPTANHDSTLHVKVLYYRPGESKPYVSAPYL